MHPALTLQTVLPICDICSVSHNLWDHWTAWCLALLWRCTENQTRELAIIHVQVELLMQDEDDVSPRLSPPLPTDLLHQEAADASGFVRASQEIEKASQEAAPEKVVSDAAHPLPGMFNFVFLSFKHRSPVSQALGLIIAHYPPDPALSNAAFIAWLGKPVQYWVDCLWPYRLNQMQNQN